MPPSRTPRSSGRRRPAAGSRGAGFRGAAGRGRAAASTGRSAGTSASRPRPGPTSTADRRVEVVFAPGLEQLVREELTARLGHPRAVRPVPGRDDSLFFDYADSWRRLLDLGTVVAPFAVLPFAVPRPKSLLSGEHLARLAHTLRAVRRINADAPPASFRFEAAGRDSSVFQRLGEELAAASGLRHVPGEGDLPLRFRRAVHPDHPRDGWEVLVRLSTRPLSDRPWRVRDVPGAAGAPIARAMALLTRPVPRDRVVNLMCGSGTLLVERLLAAPARRAVAVDADAAVLDACAANLAAAGLADAVTVAEADIREPGRAWEASGPFDVVLADPPWGTLVGDHARNEALHLALLERAHAVAAPGARLAVLTHEVRQMERCLAATGRLWEPVGETRVFQKGHHPRIYLLRARHGERHGGGAA
ncbi:RsmD family RNA methyltransferase [Streptomyces sp. 4N509B]|uniref:RsmD family RNA methyltransferase n=1 Tax=Streptomyces sp. 4N509B TaxID=3457413 RepID=UPI003FD13627